MTTAFLLLVLLLLLVLGVPIAISLGLASVLTILIFAQDSIASLTLKFLEASQSETLLAIPFFVLAGSLLTTGGVARRMIDFAAACVGHFPGGLAMASVLACMLFAAVSGSSPATVVAIGSIVIAGMVRLGYSQEFAVGVIANAGTLGILIPPSIVMVVFAAATESSVGRLFMAGIIPGAILGTLMMTAIYVVARIKNLPCQPRATWFERAQHFSRAIWGLLLIVIVLGGIYGGAFTPTEAAAVSAVYAFLVAVLVYRDLRLRDLPRVMLDAVRVTIMLMFIISSATLFAHVLTTEQIPQSIAQVLIDGGLQPWLFLIVLNVMLLIAGNFMEPSAIILILVPIVFPIALQLGIDPIHLGIIMVVNMEIGMITPPVGLNLFVASAITGMPILKVARAALPWLLLMLAFLMLITYVPEISLFLPRLMFGAAG